MKKRMQKNKLNKNSPLSVYAKKELKNEILEKKMIFFLLLLTILSFSSLLLVFINELSSTGYSSYIEGKAGTITEIDIHQRQSTVFWTGVYGLVFRIPGFNVPVSGNFDSGDVSRKDVFFNCLQQGVLGGNEVYASLSPTINFDGLQPADPSQIDTLTGCFDRADCAINTFNEFSEIYVGTRRIQNIPTFYTSKLLGDGNRTEFNLGVLTDGTNLVYVTHVEDIETLYNESSYTRSGVINFQVMLPTREETRETYFFFRDPYDICADEEIDKVLVMKISGFVYNLHTNEIISGARIVLPGISPEEIPLSDESGYYNKTILISPGEYPFVARKTGYKNYLGYLTFNDSTFEIEKDIYMEEGGEEEGTPINARIYGNVTNTAGVRLENVSVYLRNSQEKTNELGQYDITSNLISGFYTLLFYKEGYNLGFVYLDLNPENSTQEINYVLEPINLNQFPTGPHTEEKESDMAEMIRDSMESAEDYWVSTKEIYIRIMGGTYVEETVGIYNAKTSSIDVSFDLSENLQDFIRLNTPRASISSKEFFDLILTVYGTPEPGIYTGSLILQGGIEQEIGVTIEVIDQKYPIEFLLTDLAIFGKGGIPGENLKYKLLLQNLLRDQNYRVKITTRIKDFNGQEVYSEDNWETDISTSRSFLKEINIPKNLSVGDYLLEVETRYLDYFTISSLSLLVYKPVYLYSFFGVPLWIILVIISFLSFIGLNIMIYRNYQNKKKRYQISLDKSTLPDKDTERAVRVGNLAETKTPSFYEIDKLTTHAIVSGGTGMGKSISAQVLIEECLKKGVSVMVFDPTAQWSGMLRKCTDKKMTSLYPKFGLKPQDAQAFKGNVRMIKDYRQKLDINKYFAPGQIQIFSMNKLSPAEIDIFVSNFIKQIFRSDPKESPILKTLLVFDEVHRLLPKFGGSGKGFLQIERSCREFRKWGLGVMLISQVMKDFVGEIKANINTELQARTLEEGDLNRIKTKYGEEFLKSLVRAEIGVIMFQNADYNRGRPYFINFRPILHNTRRLEDEELEKYNAYNDQVDDIEFQIEELEKEKVDVFDFKMELKLVKDKIMSGSFSVVEIYLEGLKPRIQKEWEKLGKKPPERKIELVSEEEMEDEEKKAQKEHNQDSNKSPVQESKPEQSP